ncbi:unnamed protein product, partial [marine sediment metagenome]
FSVDSQGEVSGSRVSNHPSFITHSALFAYDGDTLELEGVFKTYQDQLEYLSLRMGNGFDLHKPHIFGE